MSSALPRRMIRIAAAWLIVMLVAAAAPPSAMARTCAPCCDESGIVTAGELPACCHITGDRPRPLARPVDHRSAVDRVLASVPSPAAVPRRQAPELPAVTPARPYRGDIAVLRI